MSNLKQITARMVLALLALGATGQVLAQPYCGWDYWMENAGASWWNRNVQMELALSQEQIPELNKIRSTYETEIQPLEQNLFTLRSEYHKLNSSLEPDMKKVKKVWKEMRQLRDKINDIQLTSKKAISELLTDEQEILLENGGFGWWDYGSDWWCSYDGRDGILENLETENRMSAKYRATNRWKYCW